MSSSSPQTPISKLEWLTSIAQAWHMIEERSAEVHQRYDRAIDELRRPDTEAPKTPPMVHVGAPSISEGPLTDEDPLTGEYSHTDQVEDPLEVKTSIGHFTDALEDSGYGSATPKVVSSIPSVTEQYESIDLSHLNRTPTPAQDAPLIKPTPGADRRFEADRAFEGVPGSKLGFGQPRTKLSSGHASGSSLWSREGFTPVPSVPNTQLIPPQSTHDAISYTPVDQWEASPHEASPAPQSKPQIAPQGMAQIEISNQNSVPRFESLMSAEAPREELEEFTSVAERLMRAQGQGVDEVSREEPDSSRPASFDSMYPSATPPPHTLTSQSTLVSAPERLKTRAEIPWGLIALVSLISVALGALIVYYSRAF